MTEALLVFVRGEALRAVCKSTGRHFNGLAQAARSARALGAVSRRTEKKLMAIDTACALVRHISEPSVHTFLGKLRQELGMQGFLGDRTTLSLSDLLAPGPGCGGTEFFSLEEQDAMTEERVTPRRQDSDGAPHSLLVFRGTWVPCSRFDERLIVEENVEKNVEENVEEENVEVPGASGGPSVAEPWPDTDEGEDMLAPSLGFRLAWDALGVEGNGAPGTFEVADLQRDDDEDAGWFDMRLH